MVEYTEDDIARELAEMRLNEQKAAQTTEIDGVPVVLPSGPRRRGPPRRKDASNNLKVMPEEVKGEDGQ